MKKKLQVGAVCLLFLTCVGSVQAGDKRTVVFTDTVVNKKIIAGYLARYLL